MSVRPAKTQISLGIHPFWSESSLCAQWVAKGPRRLHADNEDSDQTGRMHRLIWVFAGPTVTLLVLSCRGSSECCTVCHTHQNQTSFVIISHLLSLSLSPLLQEMAFCHLLETQDVVIKPVKLIEKKLETSFFLYFRWIQFMKPTVNLLL